MRHTFTTDRNRFRPHLEPLDDRIVPTGPGCVQYIFVAGTAMPDMVLIDEPGLTVWLNGLPVARIVCDTNVYFVNTMAGDDLVEIFDGPGDDLYDIHTEMGSDTILANDGPGSENYFLWSDMPIDNFGGADVVVVNDGPNDAIIETYQIRTGGGNDMVTILDSASDIVYDLYDVNTWTGDDVVEITDAVGRDLYFLNGGLQDLVDVLLINDDNTDSGPEDDIVGIANFEEVSGEFI